MNGRATSVTVFGRLVIKGRAEEENSGSEEEESKEVNVRVMCGSAKLPI